MKKYSKLFSLLFIAFLICSLAACKDPKEPLFVEPISYSKLYNGRRLAAYESIEAGTVHVSEHGYLFMQEQGYNGWFYLGDDRTDLIYDHAKQLWGTEKSGIAEDVLYADGRTVSRKYVAGSQGRVVISGTVRPVKSGDAQVRIYKNERVIYPSDGSDAAVYGGDLGGIFHETETSLDIGDVLRFELSGQNAAVTWNPRIDYQYAQNRNLHGLAENGRYFGDVHPFYHNGKMYMYYLDTSGNFRSRLMISEDMIRYTPNACDTHPSDPPEQPNYFALGVYKDKDGATFRSYFGLQEGFGSSQSADLHVWANGSVPDKDLNIQRKAYFDYERFPEGGRDPYAFYDPDIDRYRIIGMAYRKNDDDKSLVLYTSSDSDGRYFDKPPKELIRYGHKGLGDPECPQVIKLYDRWYILTSRSRQSAHGVGGLSYYMGGKNQGLDQVDWSSIEERRLDGEDLCAAQFVDVGGRYYLYGWLPQTFDRSDWGGILNIAREVFQTEDGTLGSRIDPYLCGLLNKGRDPGFTDALSGSDFVREGEKWVAAKAGSEGLFAGSYTRTFLTGTLSMPDSAKSSSLILYQGQKQYELKIERIASKTFLSVGCPQDTGHPVSSSLRIDHSITEFDIKVIVEGGCLVFSVNDRYTLSARTSLDKSSYRIALAASHAGTSFAAFSVNRLADTGNIYH